MSSTDQERQALAAEVETIIRQHVYADQRYLTDGRLRGVPQAAGLIAIAAERAALRATAPPAPTSPSGGDGGAAAMREACADLADQWRINGDRVAALFGMTADELAVARKTANGIAAAIRALPLPQDQAPQQGSEV